jgi:hypothetical protein
MVTAVATTPAPTVVTRTWVGAPASAPPVPLLLLDELLLDEELLLLLDELLLDEELLLLLDELLLLLDELLLLAPLALDELLLDEELPLASQVHGPRPDPSGLQTWTPAGSPPGHAQLT